MSPSRRQARGGLFVLCEISHKTLLFSSHFSHNFPLEYR